MERGAQRSVLLCSRHRGVLWHDYVAGTDPTNAASKFTAKIEMKDGAPSITWDPALNGEGVREGKRTYRVWGKANLKDANWNEVSAGAESGYNFFRVTVEMKQGDFVFAMRVKVVFTKGA